MARSSGCAISTMRSKAPGCSRSYATRRARGAPSKGITWSSWKPCSPSMSKTTIFTSCRAARAHLEDLVELLLVLREEEAGAAVVDDVLDLAGGVGGVDAVGDAAHRHGAEVGVEPLRAVVGDDRHHVARAASPSATRPRPTRRARSPYSRQVMARQMPRCFSRMATASPRSRDHVAEEPGQGVLAVHGEGRAIGRGDRAGCRSQRHVFFRFQRRVPRTLDSFTPR